MAVLAPMCLRYGTATKESAGLRKMIQTLLLSERDLVAGRLQSALNVLVQLPTSFFLENAEARTILVRVLTGLSVCRTAERLLAVSALNASTSYALQAELNWQRRSSPSLTAPMLESAHEEAIAAAQLPNLIAGASTFDFANWIEASESSQSANPRPFYAFIALAYAGADTAQLQEFGTKQLILGYREGRFAVAISTVLLEGLLLDQAERCIKFGLETWPDHGVLWMLRAKTLSRKGDARAAAMAAGRALEEMTYSPNSKAMLYLVLRAGHVSDFWKKLSSAFRVDRLCAKRLIRIGSAIERRFREQVD